jgi:hypothetical protein
MTSSLPRTPDTPDQITLTSHVWGRDKNERYYIEKRDTLKDQYTALVNESITRNRATFEAHMIFIMSRNKRHGFRGIKPEVKDEIWMSRGLALWLDFTDGHLQHWCEFMNESLINNLFLAAKVYLTTLSQHYGRWVAGGPERNYPLRLIRNMAALLEATVASFFENHNHNELLPPPNPVRFPQINYKHALGLPAFYRLNIEKDYASNPDVESVTVRVPNYLDDGVEYKNPSEFVEKWARWSSSYWKHMIKLDIKTAFETRLHQYNVGQFEHLPFFKSTWLGGVLEDVEMYPLIRDKKPWDRRGQQMIRRIAGVDPSTVFLKNTPAANWCKMMNDELIQQVYTTANTVIYLYNIHILERTPQQDKTYLFKQMILPQISHICNMFFNILKESPRIQSIEDMGIDWSGHWGMAMFVRLNFREIDEDYFKTLYPPRDGETSSVDYETELEDEEEEADRLQRNMLDKYHPFSGPVIPESQYLQSVGLNLAYLTHKNMLRGGASSALIGRSGDAFSCILSELSKGRRSERASI